MTTRQIVLTVIIATKNRPDKIISCLRALLENAMNHVEIIVMDQSDNAKTKLAIARMRLPAVTYYLSPPKGKSSALNKGLTMAKGIFVAFTDDDCAVATDWLSEILSTFENNPDVACITGNTYPYNNIPEWACPPTIAIKRTIFSKPVYHTAVGFGNNIAIRKSVFDSIGLFKPWLGPGSISSNCEDGEMILRILSHGYKILHNPNMIVYHNKKLSLPALQTQHLSYLCGEMACYTYYSLCGYDIAKTVVKNNAIESYRDFKKTCGDILKRGIVKPDEWKYSGRMLCTRLKGLSIGIFYYLKEAVSADKL